MLEIRIAPNAIIIIILKIHLCFLNVSIEAIISKSEIK
jgi:hypothetical protein